MKYGMCLTMVLVGLSGCAWMSGKSDRLHGGVNRGFRSDWGTENVALGKRVTSVASESAGYARAASRLTDGDLNTDAYPGAFALAYVVDLTAYAEKGGQAEPRGFDVESIVIHWGIFGRHFPGVKQEDGSWAPASYKADYVNQYQVSCQRAHSDGWAVVHACSSMPTVEDAVNVSVTRTPPAASSSEGDVTTTLSALGLHGVTAIRIEASGGHWIGIHELMVFGRPARAE